MIAPPSGMRVWLATGATDMRRGMNGLALQVQEALHRDPHAGDLYVFRGKRGQQATFSIQFSHCQNRVSLASAIRADVAGIAAPPREGFAMYLHGRPARP
jgi:transposase